MMKRVLLCIVLFLVATPVSAGTRYTVFWLDKHYKPHVNLKNLQPLSEGMRAILALYAMRAGSGCDYGDDGKLYCTLTSSLGLGEQCSKKEIDLVRKWFRKRIPLVNLDRDEAERVVRTGDFESLRYTVPDGASHQTSWLIIRVEPAEDKVTVYAMGSYAHVPERTFGSFRYEMVYRINADTVDVLSERELK